MDEIQQLANAYDANHPRIQGKRERDIQTPGMTAAVNKTPLGTALFIDMNRSTHTGFAQLIKKLKRLHKEVVVNKEELSPESLLPARAVILVATKLLEKEDSASLTGFIKRGGSVLLLIPALAAGGSAGEAGDWDEEKSTDALTSQYGIQSSQTAIVRSVYSRSYFHPREVLIEDSCLSDELRERIKEIKKKTDGEAGDDKGKLLSPTSDRNKTKLRILYPFGVSLIVNPPARPLLSSGDLSFPANRCIAAASRKDSDEGLIVVVGSAGIFEDDAINKEQNDLLLRALVDYIMAPKKITLDHLDADLTEFAPQVELPDIASLAERLRGCLQEPEPIPLNFLDMFDDSLFSFDISQIPEVVMLYKKMDVKLDPLTLIPPQFQVPLPPLEPAVFPPQMRELPHPALELYDLDAEFASTEVRLAQLSNKCDDTEDDLEYFVQESGEILGITEKVLIDGDSENLPKRILEELLRTVLEFKTHKEE